MERGLRCAAVSARTPDRSPARAGRAWALAVLLLAAGVLLWLAWPGQGTSPASVVDVAAPVAAGPSAGDGLVRGDADAGASAAAAETRVLRTAPAAAVGVRLPGPGRLEGRVIDRLSRAPVSDELRVELRTLPPALSEWIDDSIRLARLGPRFEERVRPVATVRSSEGTFAFEDVREGTYFLSAVGDAWAPSGAVRATVLASGEGGPVDVLVQPAGGIVGRVVTEEGAAVSGARVIAQTGVPAFFEAARRGDLVRREGVSDGGGRFRFTGLPPGRSYELTAHGEGLVPSHLLDVVVEAGATTDCTVVVRAGGRLLGRVLARDEDGTTRPIAGALVGALPRSLRDQVLAEEILRQSGGVTDTEGRYELEPVPPGEVDVIAMGPEQTPDDLGPIWLGPGGTAQVPDLVLETSPMVEGRVLDPDGLPVDGAEVRWDLIDLTTMAAPLTLAPFYAQAIERFAFPETDADGRFRAGPFGGRAPYSLYVGAPGFGWKHERWDPERDGSPIEVRLEPTGSVAGIVMDVAAAEPVQRFTVETPARADAPAGEPDGWNPFSGGLVFADSDGAFEIGGLVSGRHELEFHAPGFQGERVDVTVVAGETKRGLIVMLERGVRIVGTAVDPDGVPVAGVNVTAERGTGGPAFGRRPSNRGVPMPFNREVNEVLRRGPQEVFAGLGLFGDSAVVSDAEGRFVLDGVRPGSIRLVATHPDFVTTRSGELELSVDAQPEPVVLEMRRGATLYGLVEDLDGEPVAGALVGAFAPPSWQRARLYQSPTDAAGAYRIENVAPGSTFVGVTRGDAGASLAGLFGKLSFDLVNVPPEGELRVDLLDPTGGGVRVSGRVVRGDEPLQGGSLIAVDLEGEGVLGFDLKMTAVRTDGSFLFESLAPGRYTFSLQSDSGLARRDAEIPDVAEHRLELRMPTASISGVVRDADSGEPIESVYVEVTRVDVERGRGLLGSLVRNQQRNDGDMTDDQGRFRIEDRQPGRYEVVARWGWWMDETDSGGRAPSEPILVELGEDEHRDDLEFRLVRGAVLTGNAVRVDGGEVAGAGVRVARLGEGSFWPSSAAVSEDGTFRVPSLGIGTYVVTVTADDGATGRVEVELGPDGADVDVPLERPVSFSVIALDAQGLPAIGAIGAVRLVGASGATSGVQDTGIGGVLRGERVADADGVIEFGELAPGAYRIEIARGRERGTLDEVVLEAGTSPAPPVVRLDQP